MTASPDLQLATLRLYGELVARQSSLNGKLVLGCDAGVSASGLAAAASLAGGTALIVDPDVQAVKATFRQGGFDFVVTTLDEALRTLKNEVRQGRPLGVALPADPESVLQEMIKRGVLPDLHVGPAEDPAGPYAPWLQQLESEGMQSLRLTFSNGIAKPSPTATSWLAQSGWEERNLQPPNGKTLAAVDALLLATLTDSARRHWVSSISRYGRDRQGTGRWLWAQPGEFTDIS